jgi:3-oxoacyl-(acyl-carrier-protein) synthase
VVTGLGTLSPAGCTSDALWTAILTGASPFPEIECFDAGSAATSIAGVVPDCVDGSPCADGRALELLVAAGRLGLTAARLEDVADAALVAGTTDSAGGVVERALAGELRGSRLGEQVHLLDIAVAAARELGVGREGLLIGNASAAGAVAIATALDLVAAGCHPAVLAGGADSLRESTYFGLQSLRVLHRDGSRPFDSHRAGIRISEGAGILVVEDRDHARARGAPILAGLRGAGISNCGTHVLRSDPEGIEQAIREALASARLDAAAIDHVNCHGAGTVQGDNAEGMALRAVFGRRLREIPLTSSKPVLGHCQGAAGALEAAVAVLTLQHQVVPPTFGVTDVDPAWRDLDLVLATPRPRALGSVLSISSGLGAANAALVLTRDEL